VLRVASHHAFVPTPSSTLANQHYSRQAIQKYIKANNKVGNVSDTAFKGHVNRAIASGEEKGDFSRPKGMSAPPQRLAPVASTQRDCRRVSVLSRNLADHLSGASGTVKLAKPAATAPVAKKAEPKTEKKAAPKKATATVCVMIESSVCCC